MDRSGFSYAAEFSATLLFSNRSFIPEENENLEDSLVFFIIYDDQTNQMVNANYIYYCFLKEPLLNSFFFFNCPVLTLVI